MPLSLRLPDFLATEYSDRCKEALKEVAGMSLPNMFDLVVVKQLVQEVVESIEGPCLQLVNDCFSYAMQVQQAVASHVCGLYPGLNNVAHLQGTNAMRKAKESASRYIQDLLAKEKEVVFTLNHYYMDTVSKIHEKMAEHKKAQPGGSTQASPPAPTIEDFASSTASLANLISNDDQAARDLQVNMFSYAKVMHKRLCDVIPMELRMCLENALLDGTDGAMWREIHAINLQPPPCGATSRSCHVSNFLPVPPPTARQHLSRSARASVHSSPARALFPLSGCSAAVADRADRRGRKGRVRAGSGWAGVGKGERQQGFDSEEGWGLEEEWDGGERAEGEEWEGEEGEGEEWEGEEGEDDLVEGGSVSLDNGVVCETGVMCLSGCPRCCGRVQPHEAGVLRSPLQHHVAHAPPPQGVPARFAHLCSIMSRMHHRRKGYPFGSLVDFATDDEGHPIFLLSPLSIHTRNMLADPRCTLVVQIPGWSGLANARATIFGDVYPVPASQQQWAQRFFARRHHHGAAQMWGNFSYYRMQQICDIYFVGGFGTVAWIDVKDYLAATPDAIVLHDTEAILHELNVRLGSDLKRQLASILPQPVDDALFISIDGKGVDIRVRHGAKFNVQRLSFSASSEVRDTEEAVAALHEVLQHGVTPLSNGMLQ
ncbi:unnamed protein product [Closterium sp. Naga37s-1]|nr:unnamed protein product [Closterium sp. Naga37s-1]